MKEDFEKIKFVRKVKTRKEEILQSRRSMHARICGPVPVVNPFTAPACKISGLKSALQTVYLMVLYQIYFQYNAF